MAWVMDSTSSSAERWLFMARNCSKRLRPKRSPSALVARGNNVRVASLLDLGGTKASVVQMRAEAKDYIW